MKATLLLFLVSIFFFFGCKKGEDPTLPSTGLPEGCMEIDQSFVPNGDFETADIFPFCRNALSTTLLIDHLSPSYNGTMFVQLQSSDTSQQIMYARRIYDNCQGNFEVTFRFRVIDPVWPTQDLSYSLFKNDLSEISGDGSVPIDTTSGGDWQTYSFKYRKQYGHDEFSCIVFNVRAATLWLDDIKIKKW